MQEPADEHGDNDGRPAVIEDVVGVLVLLGDPDPEGRDEDVAGDDEGREPVLLVDGLVEYRRDPGEQGERGDVAEARGDRRRHVVRVDVAVAREDDHARRDEAEDEGGERRGHQAARAQQVRVVQGDGAVAERAHHHRHHRAQEAHHYRLAL